LIKSEKKLRELAAILSDENNLVVSGAIKSLRDEEPYEGAIALLVSLYDETDDNSILKIIEDFFNDIKDQSVRPEVIAEIKKPWKTNTISMLVASCWQSGLDYSDYLADLTDIFLTSDYATAIECMTAISESAPNSNRSSKDDIIRIVRDNPLSFTHEKDALTQELISILKE
jgi:hypothetical protein